MLLTDKVRYLQCITILCACVCVSEFMTKMDNRVALQKRPTLTRSLSNNDADDGLPNDDSVSMLEVQSATPTKSKRRPSFGIKALIGLSRKSRSTSQLAGGTGECFNNFHIGILI